MSGWAQVSFYPKLKATQRTWLDWTGFALKWVSSEVEPSEVGQGFNGANVRDLIVEEVEPT